MENNLSFKNFYNFDDRLKKIWENLEKEGDCYIFQKYQYTYNLVKAFNINFCIFSVIYDNDKPIAIFPFEIKTLKKVRILQWLGSNLNDYNCPIILNQDIFSNKNFINIWKQILNSIRDFDIIYLNKQPEFIEKISNPFVKYLYNENHSCAYQLQLKRLENDDLDFLKNKKFKNEFNRTRKKLLEGNNISFDANYIENKENLIENIVLKKISNLEKRKISHSLNRNLITFLKNLLKLYPKKIIVSTLKINKEIIARNIGIFDNKRFHYYMPVIFSEKYNSFSPGKLLIHELIKWSRKNNISIFDFGIGEEVYKKYWSNDFMKIFKHIDYRGLKGFIFFYILKCYFNMKIFSRKP